MKINAEITLEDKTIVEHTDIWETHLENEKYYLRKSNGEIYVYPAENIDNIRVYIDKGE